MSWWVAEWANPDSYSRQKVYELVSSSQIKLETKFSSSYDELKFERITSESSTTSYLSGPKWYLQHKNSKMYKNLEEKKNRRRDKWSAPSEYDIRDNCYLR
jgi:hypothetical protein